MGGRLTESKLEFSWVFMLRSIDKGSKSKY